MAAITLINNICAGAVSVSCAFIDKYLPAASGEDVKVYLYILRLMTVPGQSFNLPEAAEFLCLSQSQLMHSLKYWAGEGLLGLGLLPDGSLSSISLEASVQAPAGVPAADSTPSSTVQEAASAAAPSAQEMQLTQEERALLDNDNEFQVYMAAWQVYFPNPFTYTDVERLSYWYLRFDRSADVMDYLVEYCAGRNHANTRYMDKVASEWHRSGYRTVAQLQTYVKLKSETTGAVMKAFGLYNQSPAPAQYEYIERWIGELGFSRELIELACKRTILKLNKADFNYCEGILNGWRRNNVKTAADVAALDAQHTVQAQKTAAAKNSNVRTFHNFQERTDNNYTQMILDRYSKKEA